MHRLVFAPLALLVACGGGEPTAPSQPAPAPAAPAPAPPEPPAAPPAPDFATLSADDQKAWLMTRGEEVYKNGASGSIACVTCHQDNGQGMPPAFPPLAGSKAEMGDCKTQIGFIVNGLSGEMVVQGVTYNSAMPAQPGLSDLDLAAVVTYERNSWGNDYGICLPADAAAARQ